MEHIMVTDGYHYRSGFWISANGEAYFYPDPDEPFAFVLWYPTEDKKNVSNP
jgi:hypothetical protein